MSHLVIALDGPSYVGKSCIAHHLACLLGCLNINTGHMYRAVARLCHEQSISPSSADQVVALARNTDITFKAGEKGECQTWVNGQDWTDGLNQSEIVSYASKIAVLPALRDLFTETQRSYAKTENVVMEGRDIGSVILPHASWKFFVTASEDVRAKRMFKMMTREEQSQCGHYTKLIPRIKELDERDTNRAVAPLRQAPDAIVYDNSDSPEALLDAQILCYYVNHTAEICRNVERIQSKVLES